MTKEDFLHLNPHDQEDYLNNGGKISPDSVPGVSELVEKQQVVGDGLSSPSLESSSGRLSDSQQPAPTLAGDGNYIDKDGNKMHVNRMGAATPYDESLVNLHPEYENGFDIRDPVELLFLLNDDIASGITKLHDWQVQFMIDFANSAHNKDFPFKAVVRACNGSGKDKYIVAACVVWLDMRFRYARGVVTNGSGTQLDNQTEVYVEQLCQSANRKFAGGREEIWKCNYRYYECIPTSSPITLFATDEPNKAEGYHPLVPGGKMAIFASEAKAIPDTIFTALNRCTGFTHRVDVSTPGLPMGTFFDRCSTAVNRKQIENVKDVQPTDTIEYHITAHDCSHITKNEIETMAQEMPGGKLGAAYKSAVESEFGTTDEMVVIPYTYVWRAFTNTPQYPQPKWLPELHNKGGLDLSDGGDETVLTVRNGNKHLITIPFRFDNTQDTITFLDEQFKLNRLNHPEAYIYADCGGLGKPMLDQLKRMGWGNIRYVDNRATPFYPKTYLNRGTELWFHIRKLMERHELIMLKDDKLIRQLSTRYYKMDLNNRHRLLSKIESRSRGYPSPDRGDSFVLAFWDYKSTYKEPIPHKEDDRPFKVAPNSKPANSFTLKHHAKGSDSVKQRLGKRPDMYVLQELLDGVNRDRKLNQVESETKP